MHKLVIWHARFTCLAGFAAVLLSGCSSYRAAPISPAQTAAALDARSLDDPQLHRFIAAQLAPAAAGKPDPAWDLARLTLAAVYYHPDLDIARAQLSSARAAVLRAGERPNPRLDLAAVFGLGAAVGAIPADAAPVTAGPVISLLVETFGKRGYRTAQAQHLAEAAREGIATAAWQVRGRVRGALMDLWAAERRLALARRQLDLQDELVTLLADRLAAGAASALDLARERIRRTRFALAVRDSERARDDARAQLATAIGLPLAALDGATLSFAALDHPAAPPAGVATGGLRRLALTQRSDVKAALASYEAAQSGLQLAIAGQYPDVTLGPGYQYDFGVDKFLLGPSMTLPIFNQNQGAIAEALAARRTAAARFTALQARIIGAIDRAAADYRAAGTALATADSLVADAQRREGQVRRSFAAGAVDRPTLVAAGLEYVAAALSRLDAVVRQRRALGALEDALQYPLLSPDARFPAPEESPRRTAEPVS